MFTLNPRDPNPIYTQVKAQFIRLITCGVLAEGDKLPSVRQLATQLSINPNTIQRAYAELEAEGYCFSQAGRGNFVAPRAEWDTSHRAALEAQFVETANALRSMGVSGEALIALLANL